jgi:hypothetical protein
MFRFMFFSLERRNVLPASSKSHSLIGIAPRRLALGTMFAAWQLRRGNASTHCLLQPAKVKSIAYSRQAQGRHMIHLLTLETQNTNGWTIG